MRLLGLLLICWSLFFFTTGNSTEPPSSIDSSQAFFGFSSQPNGKISTTSTSKIISLDHWYTRFPRIQNDSIPLPPSKLMLPHPTPWNPSANPDNPTRTIGILRPKKSIFRQENKLKTTIPETEIIFLTNQGPIRLHLHFPNLETQLSNHWELALRKMFDFIDRDKDGYLNSFEVELALSRLGMQQLIRSGTAYPNINDPGRGLADFDQDDDQLVSFAEFKDYYQPLYKDLVSGLNITDQGFRLDQFRKGLEPTKSNPLSDPAKLSSILFEWLDSNSDGTLSKEELESADRIISTIDENGDGVISSDELQNHPRPKSFKENNANPVPVISTKGPLEMSFGEAIPENGTNKMGMMSKNENKSQIKTNLFRENPKIKPEFFHCIRLSPVSEKMDDIIEDLLFYYDKNRDFRLSREEFPIAKKWFDQLDVDNNQMISLVELMNFRKLPPDSTIWCHLQTDNSLTFKVSLQKTDQDSPINSKVAPRENLKVTESKNDNGQTVEMNFQQGLQNLMIMPSTTFTSNSNVTTLGVRNNGGPVNFADLVKRSLRGPKTFIKESELNSAQFDSLLILVFDLLDANNDGMVTIEEAEECTDIYSRFYELRIAFSIEIFRPTLFEFLDSNHNYMLSRNELKNSWKLLSKYIPTGETTFFQNDFLVNANLVHSHRSIQKENPKVLVNPDGKIVSNKQKDSIRYPKTPLWFKKMDRNQDNELTWREFIGTKKAFDEIDTDQDGVISLKEAIAYTNKKTWWGSSSK